MCAVVTQTRTKTIMHPDYIMKHSPKDSEYWYESLQLIKVKVGI